VNAQTWNERYAEKELVWTSQPNRFLVSETDGLMPGSVLDLACGEGRNAIWLAEQGWRATGVDFADVGIAKARELAASRGVECKWLVADLAAYEPPAHEFDLVILFYLQLSQHELGPVVARAATAVAAGGTFLLVAHDSRNLKEGHGGPKDPTVLYTAEDVVPHLDDLTVERAESVIRPVETDAGVRNAIDVLVRAKRTW
jgi:SAM-dependent methyltransferase